MLPFTNMSGDPEQEYFADGITEDIITGCRAALALRDRPQLVLHLQGQAGRHEAGRRGARRALRARRQRAQVGERVRITAQLIDATTGNHIWAERYDRELADVFAVQDEITERVVAAIEPQLYAAESVSGAAQAAGEHRRLGPGDAGAVALLAG